MEMTMVTNAMRILTVVLSAVVLVTGSLAATGAELLGTSRVVFVTSKVEKFGNFEPRPNAVFQPGEEVRLYAEPTGFVTVDENRATKIDMTTDIKVSTSDGRVLLEKKNLLTFKQTSEKEIGNVFVNMAVNVRATGQYILTLRLNENSTGRYLDYSVPFLVKAQEKFATSAQ